MAKEGKHDRYSRKLCELLNAQLGGLYQYTGPPEHGLVKRTSFGMEGFSVLLQGKNSPHLQLDFMVGAHHDAFENAWSRLELPRLLGSFRFWTTTGNAVYAWPGLERFPGNWSMNLNDDPGVLLPAVMSSLPQCLMTINECYSDLERVHGLWLEGDRRIFGRAGWPEMVVMDVALSQWKRLAAFLHSEQSRAAWDRDEALLANIERVFGWKAP